MPAAGPEAQAALDYFLAESAASEAASAAFDADFAALDAELAALEAAVAWSAALLALLAACEASELALAAIAVSVLVLDEASVASLWHAASEMVAAAASTIAVFFTKDPPCGIGIALLPRNGPLP